ncbi:MAG TPA: DUF177 domain-containing protein [Dehalococcoidia bacterium]|nr:DUF177 domain-containing protein [Dehalococcoidia bacterium]
MQFHVLRELRQSIGSVNEYDLAEDRVVVDDDVLRDLTGTARFLRTDRGLLVTVHADTKLETECSRCAAEVQAPMDIEFEEEYVPTVDPETGTRVYVSEEDEAFRIDPQFWLDLREGLRQYILLNEPAKPLCREDCAGLCPNCGADLNQSPCQCQPTGDERWSVLTGLKNEIDEGE